MIYDLDFSKFKELMVGTTGGVLLFYLVGCLMSYNLSGLRALWWVRPRIGVLFFLFLSSTITFSYVFVILSGSESQEIMASFINADGSYQRKGSILTILYIAYIMTYIFIREKFNKLRKYLFICLLPVTAIMIFYSQYVRSNSAFATILAIYFFTVILELSCLKLKARMKVVCIGSVLIVSALGYFIKTSPGFLDFFSYFRILGYGAFEFSSVTSRVNLFMASLEQFDYGPIFGDMNSDLKAGQVGKYPHNLLAHALTHLGLLGFVWMICVCTLLIIRSRFNVLLSNLIKKKPTANINTDALVVIVPIIFISVFFQTITWAPLWFTIGLSFPIVVRRHFKID
jgi:hypothetical protein